MTARVLVAASAAAIAGSVLAGMAAPERELVFFLFVGAAAGHLNPLGERWAGGTLVRVAGGMALGFLACYARLAEWAGLELPLRLADAWPVLALALMMKALILLAAFHGIYAHLRRDGLLRT